MKGSISKQSNIATRARRGDSERQTVYPNDNESSSHNTSHRFKGMEYLLEWRELQQDLSFDVGKSNAHRACLPGICARSLVMPRGKTGFAAASPRREIEAQDREGIKQVSSAPGKLTVPSLRSRRSAVKHDTAVEQSVYCHMVSCALQGGTASTYPLSDVSGSMGAARSCRDS